jgi:hypothetical protein
MWGMPLCPSGSYIITQPEEVQFALVSVESNDSLLGQ